MHSFKRSVAVLFSAAALLGAALVPAFASAQVYYPSTTSSYNCNGYMMGQYYGNNYNGNQNCGNQGTVTIYTQVNNQYGGTSAPSNFTFYVSGATSGQQYVTASQNGAAVWVSGTYSVSLYNQAGYMPSYSAGCSGTVSMNQNNVCYVTLTSIYNNTTNPYYPQQYYPTYPVQTTVAPVTIVSKYVPTLPNTGFAPISSASVAFALVLLLAAAGLVFPYVRKALAAILG